MLNFLFQIGDFRQSPVYYLYGQKSHALLANFLEICGMEAKIPA